MDGKKSFFVYDAETGERQLVLVGQEATEVDQLEIMEGIMEDVIDQQHKEQQHQMEQLEQQHQQHQQQQETQPLLVLQDNGNQQHQLRDKPQLLNQQQQQQQYNHSQFDLDDMEGLELNATDKYIIDTRYG